MSSVGAVTAADSRGISAESSSQGYRIVLPPLPKGVHALNSVFLHADITARPYRIEDFKAGLEKAGVLGEIAACGSFQMNHVWMVTLKTPLAKKKLVDAASFEAKGRRCVVIDPEKAEVRLKLHWIPFHLLDETVKKALEPYGKVEDVARETWRVGGFEGVQSTTRVARLTLREGVTLEKLPHQLRLPGCTALVLAPGRAPLCLRCRRTGHIRRECRVPRCESCRRFGHLRDDCKKTYADVANGGPEDDALELLMDQDEAEDAAGGNSEGSQPQGRPETGGNQFIERRFMDKSFRRHCDVSSTDRFVETSTRSVHRQTLRRFVDSSLCQLRQLHLLAASAPARPCARWMDG
uniref:CCHC-type domain-containing protein n=1 Tax=Ixodes ricinus TaxID=34613 RepID=A0A6B0VA87_IXORI